MKTYAELVSEAKRMIREIVPEELVARQKAGGAFVLLDVREADEFAAGRIPGAVNLPRGLLELDISKVVRAPETMIICNCGGGGRSALAARTLGAMGYENVASLAGGFKAWVGKDLPVQR